MSELRCRPVALLMLVLFLGGCTTWQPTTVSPRVVVEQEQPLKIRVTSTRGDITVMPDPGIVNDSLVSLQERCQTGVVAVDGEECPAMMALDEVRSLDVARIDPEKRRRSSLSVA